MSNYFLEHYGVVGMRWGKRSRRTLAIDGPSIQGTGKSGGGFKSDNIRNKPIDVDYKHAGSSKSSTSGSSSSRANRSNNNSDYTKNRKETTNDSSSTKTKKAKTYDYEYESTKTSNNTETNPFDPKTAKDGITGGKKLLDAGVKQMDAERKKRTEKQLKADATKMTDDELKAVINRLSMEDRYVSVMEKQGMVESKSDLQKTLEVVGQVAAYADTALSVYAAIDQVRNRR